MTTEYNRSNATVATNSISAYQHGATGAGIKIGIVDTGLNPNLPELTGRIDPASRDIAGNRPMEDLYGHGTAVASIAAAARDGFGMHGIAFDASIVMLKADAPGSCPSNCNIVNIAEGINAARVAGARVINLSVGGNADSAIIEAVRTAAQAGVIVVVASGNDSAPLPTSLARDVASAAPGTVIIAGAVGSGPYGSINYDTLVSYSNRAGSFQNAYLAAPGFLTNATTLNGGVDAFSGTSFAAPVVSGAVALLAQAFPSLSASQIVEILLMTADDLGETGPDSVYGRGRINVGRAFQPIGKTTVAGSSTSLAQLGGALPRAAGDAALKGGLPAIVFDEYSRAFKTNLATNLRAARRNSILAPITHHSSHVNMGFGSANLSFSVTKDRLPQLKDNQLGLDRGSGRQWMSSASFDVEVSSGRSVAFGVSTTSEELERKLDAGSAIPSFLIDASSPEVGFSRDARISFAFRQQVGPLAFGFAAESGHVLTDGGLVQNSNRYRIRSLRVDLGLLDVSFGYLSEHATVLGGRLADFFGSPGARTAWLNVHAGVPLGGAWQIDASLKRGRTDFHSGSFSTAAYSFTIQTSGVVEPGDRLAMGISQPLRVQRGGIKMKLPGEYDYSTHAIAYRPGFLSLVPQARELAAETTYSKNMLRGILDAHAYARLHNGHVEAAPPEVGAALRLRMNF